jgi:hypothetical protein
MHRRLVPSLVILLMSLLAFSGPALGQETILFSPLSLFNPTTTLTFTPGVPSTSVRITSSQVGQGFVHLGLTVPSSVTIEGVRLEVGGVEASKQMVLLK